MTRSITDLLEQRAKRLAQPSSSTTEVSFAEELIGFSVGELKLGVPLISLRAVVRKPRCSVVSGLPVGIVGVTAFKGELISILDYGVWAGMSAPCSGRVLAILTSKGRPLGLMVDEILELRLHEEHKEANTVSLGANAERCVRRVTAELISILDVEALFERLSPHREVSHG